MKFNEKKFFELAKENNFEAADVYFHKNHSLSFSIYHGQVDSYTENENSLLTARGIYKGKFGTITTESIDKDTPEYLINGIIRTAKIIENDDPTIIFKGSEKYHKSSVFNKNVMSDNPREKVEILLDIEKKLLAFDKRINEVVTVGYEESYGEDRLSNSYGLKLSQKQADCSYFAEITVKDGDEVRSGFKVFSSLNPEEFNTDNFVKEVAEDALAKLGATQCNSKKYLVVFNPDTASILINCLLNSLDAEEVQKHTSVFEGKLGQQALSKKLTIMENPLKKTVFFRYFDDEGVATNKKYLIKNGVIKTYLYTLQTAEKDGVEPTGNGYRGSSKASASTALTIVKPSKTSEEQMLSTISEGIYITELEGLHSGMNSQSGNFSLQAAGFMIRNGKMAEPLSLITVAGNLFDVFNKIKCIASNSKLVLRSHCECPSILISKMAVSGK